MAQAQTLAQIAERALDFVKEGSIVGLGSGNAATAFVQALAARVRGGFRIQAVPTSVKTAELARELEIPVFPLDKHTALDIAVDGADEVDPRLDLIKGYGGAFVREKIVACAAKQFVVLVGAEKMVPVLGARGILPIEVVPFGLAYCRRRLAELGYSSTARTVDGERVVSDNGNHILDCAVGPLTDPAALDAQLRAIPGVVGTGLFLGMAHAVVVGREGAVEIRRRGE